MKKSHLLTLIFSFASLSLLAQIPEIEEDVEIDDIGMEEVYEVPNRPRGPQYRIRVLKEGRQLVYGDSILTPVYDNIEGTRMGAYITMHKGKYGLLDKTGKPLLDMTYDSIYRVAYTADLILKKNGKYGAVHNQKEKLLLPEYGKILYADLGKNTIVLDDTGKSVIFDNPYDFEPGFSAESVRFSNGIFIAKVGGKDGVFKWGKVLVPFQYDTIYSRSPDPRRRVRQPRNPRRRVNLPKIGYSPTAGHGFMVKSGDYYGLYSLSGEMVLAAEYDRIHFDHLRRLYKIQKGKLHGVYTSSGKMIIPVEYDNIYTDGARYITVTKDKKKGIFDYRGNAILPVEFESISIRGWSTSFLVQKNGKYGWYSPSGKVMIPIIYDKLDDFGSFQPKYKGLFKATIDGKLGIIDTNKVIIPVKYSELWSIYDGRYFVVTENGKKGLYDIKGNLVLPIKYDWVSRGTAKKCETLIIRNDGLKGLFVNADTIIEPQFKVITHILDRERLVRRAAAPDAYKKVQNAKGKWGVINEYNGQIVIPVEYDEIPQTMDSRRGQFFIVKKKGKYGILDKDAKVTVPIQYQFLTSDNSMWTDPGNDSTLYIIAQKKGKYGAISLFNRMLLQFEYEDLGIVYSDLMAGGLRLKAKIGGKYALIDHNGKALTEFMFDEIAQFERGKAMAFTGGENSQMRLINTQGRIFGEPVAMKPHSGFTSFEELKAELYQVLMDSSDEALMGFCLKIAPSDHTQYFVPKNIFSKKPMSKMNMESVALRYFFELKEFRNFDFARDKERYRLVLLEDEDYVSYEHGLVTIYRSRNHAYGDRSLEKILRHAFKVNGYWISGHYMSHRFR